MLRGALPSQCGGCDCWSPHFNEFLALSQHKRLAIVTALLKALAELAHLFDGPRTERLIAAALNVAQLVSYPIRDQLMCVLQRMPESLVRSSFRGTAPLTIG